MSSQLPSLPVPDLKQTLSKFLMFSKPLLSTDEFMQTNQIVREFQQSDEAELLQGLLEKRARNFPNWLTPWWLDIAYLSGRTPLPVVTSPGVTFPCFKFTGTDGQIEYAAKIIQSALQFHHLILRNELRADMAQNNPLDMSQYSLLFGTTRIPRHTKDLIRYGIRQPKMARHILVTSNGHTFKMDVYNDAGGMLGIDQLQSLLREILSNTSKASMDAINIVSSDDRESWAEVYERLKRNNPAQMETVEDALFLICLDREFDDEEKENLRPEDRNMAMALHGGGPNKNSNNRWFDKTLQFYINENGYGGLTYEHTPAEGPPLARLLDYIFDQINDNARSFLKTIDGPFQKPQELFFKLESADRQAMDKAGQNLQRVVKSLEIKSLAFNDYGKNVPKQAQLSPDSWIQVALQLAYFRLHHAHAPAYETATLRKFQDGRTDTIRLPTPESVKFVEAFSKQTHLPSINELLTAAIKSHKSYAADAMNGKGMDRHLLGLKLIAMENGRTIPKILRTKAYERLMHFLLSTSQVPTKHVLPMGFGPSDADCYGVCYNPQNNRIFFTITAFNDCRETSAERFSGELARALTDMRDVAEKMYHTNERAKL